MHGFSTYDKPRQDGSIISSTNIGITFVIFQQGMINVLINKKKKSLQIFGFVYVIFNFCEMQNTIYLIFYY